MHWSQVSLFIHHLALGANMYNSLAMVEMKVLLAEVYSRFRTEIAPDMHGSMDIDDQIIASRPKDQTCKLLFFEVDM